MRAGNTGHRAATIPSRFRRRRNGGTSANWLQPAAICAACQSVSWSTTCATPSITASFSRGGHRAGDAHLFTRTSPADDFGPERASGDFFPAVVSVGTSSAGGYCARGYQAHRCSLLKRWRWADGKRNALQISARAASAGHKVGYF